MSVAWFSQRPRVAADRLLRTTRRRCVPIPNATIEAHPRSTTPARRTLLTLAIESSCDDTCVAILDKSDPPAHPTARLLFNEKITSDNRHFQGVHPLAAVVSHTAHLGPLIREALRALPEAPAVEAGTWDAWKRLVWVDGVVRRKPDFVAVTRGPGMTSNLATGLNTAKGLAAAWDVPLVGVNHMQAHALTPRLVAALGMEGRGKGLGGWEENPDLQFPFLSLLVSGGHTLLVHSHSLTDHNILAEAMNIAIGDMLDKCARAIIPASEISASENVMYGPMLERFAFPEITFTSGPPHTDSARRSSQSYDYTPPPRRAEEIEIFDSGHGWTLTPPLSGTAAMTFDFAGFNSQVQGVVLSRPDMPIPERRLLARHTMRLAFEHLSSRVLLALQQQKRHKRGADVKTLVVAGGVASNRYLMHILRSMLDVRGFGHIEINAPPPALCIDNAAMIAWTGMEMYEAGWRSEVDILAMRKWPVDPRAEGGGILGAEGWLNVMKKA